jgi:arylsulfatase A-like enzyme
MRILMVSSEVESLARTGGLGDVVEALSLALAELGDDVLVVTPLYGVTRLPVSTMRWPGTIPAGGRTSQVAVTMDLTATFLALAGARAPAAAPLDGIDLMPALTGGSGAVRRELYWRIFQRRKQKAVRSGDWKYLWTETGESLHDLAADPGEARDLKAEHPAVFQQLRAKVAAWEREVLPPIPLDPARA